MGDGAMPTSIGTSCLLREMAVPGKGLTGSISAVLKEGAPGDPLFYLEGIRAWPAIGWGPSFPLARHPEEADLVTY